MNVKDAAWHTAHDYGFEELASRMGIKSAQVYATKSTQTATPIIYTSTKP